MLTGGLLGLQACLPAVAAPAPAGYVLSGMPLIRQTYNACGPASLTQVLEYFGLRLSLAEVSRATRPSEQSYMTAQAIVAFAPQVGLEARLFTGGTLTPVRAAIRARLPVIALQNHYDAGGRRIPHWRVVVGYDDARQVAYLMDPLLGYVTMPYPDFQRVWAEQRGQFAVMYPPAWRGLVKRSLGV